MGPPAGLATWRCDALGSSRLPAVLTYAVGSKRADQVSAVFSFLSTDADVGDVLVVTEGGLTLLELGGALGNRTCTLALRASDSAMPFTSDHYSARFTLKKLDLLRHVEGLPGIDDVLLLDGDTFVLPGSGARLAAELGALVPPQLMAVGRSGVRRAVGSPVRPTTWPGYETLNGGVIALRTRAFRAFADAYCPGRPWYVCVAERKGHSLSNPMSVEAADQDVWAYLLEERPEIARFWRCGLHAETQVLAGVLARLVGSGVPVDWRYASSAAPSDDGAGGGSAALRISAAASSRRLPPERPPHWLSPASIGAADDCSVSAAGPYASAAPLVVAVTHGAGGQYGMARLVAHALARHSGSVEEALSAARAAATTNTAAASPHTTIPDAGEDGVSPFGVACRQWVAARADPASEVPSPLQPLPMSRDPMVPAMEAAAGERDGWAALPCISYNHIVPLGHEYRCYDSPYALAHCVSPALRPHAAYGSSSEAAEGSGPSLRLPSDMWNTTVVAVMVGGQPNPNPMRLRRLTSAAHGGWLTMLPHEVELVIVADASCVLKGTQCSRALARSIDDLAPRRVHTLATSPPAAADKPASSTALSYVSEPAAQLHRLCVFLSSTYAQPSSRDLFLLVEEGTIVRPEPLSRFWAGLPPDGPLAFGTVEHIRGGLYEPTAATLSASACASGGRDAGEGHLGCYTLRTASGAGRHLPDPDEQPAGGGPPYPHVGAGLGLNRAAVGRIASRREADRAGGRSGAGGVGKLLRAAGVPLVHCGSFFSAAPSALLEAGSAAAERAAWLAYGRAISFHRTAEALK